MERHAFHYVSVGSVHKSGEYAYFCMEIYAFHYVSAGSVHKSGEYAHFCRDIGSYVSERRYMPYAIKKPTVINDHRFHMYMYS